MKKISNSLVVNDFKIEEICRDNSFYVRFGDGDIEVLAQYAFDMDYVLEPEIMKTDPEHPLRFKIISKSNPGLYGWVSKVIEMVDDQWQDAFLYGFYRYGSFRIKYPITFNVQKRMMRGIIKRKAENNPRQKLYFRIMFGILDLEPQASPLDFVLSWLSGCKIQYVSPGRASMSIEETSQKQQTPFAVSVLNPV